MIIIGIHNRFNYRAGNDHGEIRGFCMEVHTPNRDQSIIDNYIKWLTFMNMSTGSNPEYVLNGRTDLKPGWVHARFDFPSSRTKAGHRNTECEWEAQGDVPGTGPWAAKFRASSVLYFAGQHTLVKWEGITPQRCSLQVAHLSTVLHRS